MEVEVIPKTGVRSTGPEGEGGAPGSHPTNARGPETRQSDSPTGVGSPPEFPRGRNTSTRPPPSAPLGNAGVPSAPWENHFDVIPGAAPGRTETPTPKRLREPRLSDSATGGGGTADLPRERETTTRPHLLPPRGFPACRRPPWENHFDVIPGAPPGRTENLARPGEP